MITRMLATFLAMLMGLLPLIAYADVTVGQDIAEGDITELFWTWSSSTFPPFYLRYRFYVENGEKRLFHETREGEEWPLTTEHTVLTGTVDISDEDWDAFYDCLRGGTITPRSDSVTDGDPGPWMYLYWTGDPGDVQQFSFESYGQEVAFKELASRLAGNHVLTRFYFLRGGYMAPQTYEVTRRKDGWFLSHNEQKPVPFDTDLAEALQKIVEEYDLLSWDGYNKSDSRVLDGESFRLQLRYADGWSAYAYGSNSFPREYREVTDRLEAIWKQHAQRKDTVNET